MLGLYLPGRSWLHRASPGFKLLTLLVSGVLVFLLRDWRWLLALLSGVLGLYALAQLGWQTVWGQVRPALGMLLFLLVIQGWTTGWMSGWITVLRFGVMILLASLVTLTTRVSGMLTALERALAPLRHVGVNPARVSLAFSLTIRFIPVITQVMTDVREAQQARGIERNMVALAVPVIIRTLKMADDVADAISARSFED